VADKWGRLTHGPRLSVSLRETRVQQRGAFIFFSMADFEKDFKNEFLEFVKKLPKIISREI
jgi:hypothetical protein